MKISPSAWADFVKQLSQLDDIATGKVADYITNYRDFDYRNAEHMKDLVGYAFSISNKYGEAAAALACEMYDAVGTGSGLFLPPASPAETAKYRDVAKAVYGTAKNRNTNMVAGSVGRLVKRTGQDTILTNALRDGAQFAWVPNGDTCAFCLTLASRGWQKMSRKALKNGHAEHIHSNCDCTYAVRFDNRTQVPGYNPEKYLEMYNSVDGNNPTEKVNAIRRIKYQENKDRINAQKRAAYAEKGKAKEEKLVSLKQSQIEASSPFKNPETPLTIVSYDQSKHIVGGKKYNEYMKTHEYEPSILTISEDEAQKLVEKYHGTGILKLDKNGNITNSEIIIDNDDVIGYAVNNQNGERAETTGFKIHYSSKGTHIVPTYESQKVYWKEKRSQNGNDWLLRQKS